MQSGDVDCNKAHGHLHHLRQHRLVATKANLALEVVDLVIALIGVNCVVCLAQLIVKRTTSVVLVLRALDGVLGLLYSAVLEPLKALQPRSRLQRAPANRYPSTCVGSAIAC